ncbi:MAG: ribosome recycling factor [Pseudomonadota bacterium]
MIKSLKALDVSFGRIRTGRASLSLLDGVRVDYYGSQMPLNQIASLSIPEPRAILISPWDSKVIGEIERALLKSELGLTPMSDGKIVRINIPALTAERRKDLAKVVRKMAEEAKVGIRNIRRDANELFKDLKKEKEISEDEQFRAQEDVQKLTDDYIKRIDEALGGKEKEIIEF